MGNTPSLEGEDKDKYIEEQKQIILRSLALLQRFPQVFVFVLVVLE